MNKFNFSLNNSIYWVILPWRVWQPEKYFPIYGSFVDIWFVEFQNHYACLTECLGRYSLSMTKIIHNEWKINIFEK